MAKKLSIEISNVDELCAYYRGQVIHDIVSLEDAIDFYLLCYYFRETTGTFPIPTMQSIEGFDNRLNEFRAFFFSRLNMNLSLKFEALALLIETHCKKYLTENKLTGRGKKSPNFISTIRRLIGMRNVFAHLKLDWENSDLETGEIQLFVQTIIGKQINKQPEKFDFKKLDKFKGDFESSFKILCGVGQELLTVTENNI